MSSCYKLYKESRNLSITRLTSYYVASLFLVPALAFRRMSTSNYFFSAIFATPHRYTSVRY